MLGGGRGPGDDGYFDFSFSGLKTAVATLVEELEREGGLGDDDRADVAAAFQEAAVDVLASKTEAAVRETGCRRVLLGGGVSANGRLRREMAARLGSEGRLFHASPRFSLDNGAMVARAGLFRLERGDVAEMDVTARANLPFPGLLRGDDASRIGAVLVDHGGGE